MKILIKITQEILDKTWMCGASDRCDISQQCAVAEAVREIFPKAIVGPAHMFFTPKSDALKLPKNVRHWLTSFDRLNQTNRRSLRKALPLISFEVEVPEELIDDIGLEEVHKVLKESKTLELVSI